MKTTKAQAIPLPRIHSQFGGGTVMGVVMGETDITAEIGSEGDDAIIFHMMERGA